MKEYKADSERLNDLWELSVSRYLDKSDYDILEGLNDEEGTEYIALHRKINGYCIACGEDEADCVCKPK